MELSEVKRKQWLLLDSESRIIGSTYPGNGIEAETDIDQWSTDDGIPRYRWDGTQAVERTEEELEADRKAREPVLTPAQQREQAYNTQPIVEWDGQLLTVTEAAQQWAYYSAEGATGKTLDLTALISQSKRTIREQYPDETE